MVAVEIQQFLKIYCTNALYEKCYRFMILFVVAGGQIISRYAHVAEFRCRGDVRWVFMLDAIREQVSAMYAAPRRSMVFSPFSLTEQVSNIRQVGYSGPWREVILRPGKEMAVSPGRRRRPIIMLD